MQAWLNRWAAWWQRRDAQAQWLAASLPVLLACCWQWLRPLQWSAAPLAWAEVLQQGAQLALWALPLWLAQIVLVSGLPELWRWGLWGCGFVLYPLGLSWLPGAPADGLFSTIAWLLLYGGFLLWFFSRHKVQPWRRPWLSLDQWLLALLSLWTIGWAALLTTHQQGMAVQPIPLRVELVVLWQQPAQFASYLLQFGVMAAVMYGYYWLNRYWLIRRLLSRHGTAVFILSALCLLLLSYAPVSALLLQLPLNQHVEVPALPAGNQLPFHRHNFYFAVGQWLLTTPLILLTEWQQQQMALEQAERRSAQVAQQQMAMELQLLQQQIQPHFLFNTLNNLYALCLQQSAEAAPTVLRLADLMRYVVYDGQKPWVPLAQDIAYLQNYLALQQLRTSHRNQLQAEFPAVPAQLQLPPLLLVMLLENAFKHGVESHAGASWVRVSLTLTDDQLKFQCDNSLPDTPTDASGGVGLQNLRRRLQLLYGEAFSLVSAPVINAPAPHWHAALSIPLQPLSGQWRGEA